MGNCATRHPFSAQWFVKFIRRNLAGLGVLRYKSTNYLSIVNTLIAWSPTAAKTTLQINMKPWSNVLESIPLRKTKINVIISWQSIYIFSQDFLRLLKVTWTAEISLKILIFWNVNLSGLHQETSFKFIFREQTFCGVDYSRYTAFHQLCLDDIPGWAVFRSLVSS